MTAKEPIWLSKKAIRAIHEALIARTGGSYALNSGMLDSNLYKAKNIYDPADNSSIFELAAAYGYSFLKNHCFADGNKRVALALVAVFLQRNGYRLDASEAEAVRFFRELASAVETQQEVIYRLTSWIENHVTPAI